MKFTKTDFLRADHHTIMLDEDLSERDDMLLHNTDVKEIPYCHIQGSLYFDGKQMVYSKLHLEGQMVILDSITNEDLTIDFDTESERLYSFGNDSGDDLDIYFAPQETVELLPEIYDAVIYEAPAALTTLSREDYPKGEGWELLSEEEAFEKKDEIDPRWAILDDFEVEE